MYRIPAAIHPDIHADTPPDRLDSHEKMRIRAASFRVKKLYPGPVGELVARELMTWEEFGFRFQRGGLIAQVVDEIMAAQP